MAEHDQTALKHGEYLLLDQSLLRLPNELLRKNFRSAHFTIEKDTTALKTLLKDSATAAASGRATQQDALRSLDAMLGRMRGVKRKLAAHASEEDRLHTQTAARIVHLDQLYAIHTVEDVKYEAWSRRRLDRLLADYLLRNGFSETAEQLAVERDMEALVDIETFKNMSYIRESLLGGNITEALAWCTENKKELRKMESKLEFLLRVQQYVELIRSESQPKLFEAIAHAKKYLVPYWSTYPNEVKQVGSLLAFPPSATARSNYGTYAELYSRERWVRLADVFTTAHNNLLGLPSAPLLHLALSSGLSALKTPACHSKGANKMAKKPKLKSKPKKKTATTTTVPAADTAQDVRVPSQDVGDGGDNDDDGGGGDRSRSGSGTGVRGGDFANEDREEGPKTPPPPSTIGRGVCPICSVELNDLAGNVPYAHHTQSHVEHDLVMLPNGRVYGRQRLEDKSRKAGLPPLTVRDIQTGQLFSTTELKRVFIT